MADPFIDKKMTEKIFYIKEKIPFAAIRLSSNGGPLVPKIAEKIADSPLDSMTFNVPGYYKETYESMITKVPYDKMKENISYYLKLPKKYNTEVEMNIVQNNQISDKEVDEYCDYWTGLGANINVTRITNCAGAINDESLLTYDKNEQSKPLKGCELDRQLKMFHILYNGDVNLCCMDWNREEILGNVMEHSIEEVWNSKPYNEIRKKLLSKIAYSDDFICNRCSEAVR